MNAVLTQSAAQNDTYGVVILNPSAVLRINSVKDLILKLSHYAGDGRSPDRAREIFLDGFGTAQ